MRGKPSPDGTMRKAPNGYWYQKTPQGWRLYHHVIVELKLGRPLKPGERVYFIDGNRDNYEPDNLDVVDTKPKRLISVENQMFLLKDRLAKLEQELQRIKGESDEQES